MRTLAKGCEIRLHYSNKNSEMLQDEQDVGNEETDFRIKNLLSWQNILSNRQTAADIEEKMSQSRRSPSSRNQSYFLLFHLICIITITLRTAYHILTKREKLRNNLL